MSNDNKINSSNLLPEYFQTDKNKKFLSSTLDQLIQPAQLERISGFIGSRLSPNYNVLTDNYISEVLEFRRDYQFNPALVVYDELQNIQRAIGIDDLTNTILIQSGLPGDFNKLYGSSVYSYNPHISWDKFTNYQEYYWLPTGPETIFIDSFNSIINVETDIIGKSNYTFSYITNIGSTEQQSLSNGMKIKFSSHVSPKNYQNKTYFVEGVGTSIVLVDYDQLTASIIINKDFLENFDTLPFDHYPFDNANSLSEFPEYITINRASRDLNPWSRYNRWVHKEIINTSATVNGTVPVYDASARAKRPIVEFNANLKLYNFGTVGILKIDIIDTDTIDAFNIVEGAEGYFVDGVPLAQGNKIIFNADKNQEVRGTVYEVNFTKVNGVYQIQLLEVQRPPIESSIIVNYGKTYLGTSWHFDGNRWIFSQQHRALNEFPLFDLFDNEGNSYSDRMHYQSDFSGNKLFNYAVGTGPIDPVLGFPLLYKNSVGVGSYLFNNYFMTGIITISNNNILTNVPTSTTYLKYFNLTGDVFVNVWQELDKPQIPILQFQTTIASTASIQLTAISNPVKAQFEFDVYVNNIKLSKLDYSTTTTSANYFVNFNNLLPVYSNVLFKIYNTTAVPTLRGSYQIPLSLTNNPLNGPIGSMTETEITDHVKTMINASSNFSGNYPGLNNLRDLAVYKGTQLISNANPLPFAFLFIGDKYHNLIDAVQDAGEKYNQFKLSFLKQIASQSDQIDYVSAVDIAISNINQNKKNVDSYSLSDMIGYGQDKIVRTWTVTDSRNTVYPLTNSFDLSTLNLRSVLVYINGVQLISNIDYKFIPTDSSVEFLIKLKVGDVITINDYQDTSKCYIPPTPSKLGLYPVFVPSIYVDNTYITPQKVIQGHDGSITIAYNDYRDEVILELEKRIYNNIKAAYRSELFDINSVLPGNFRNSEYSTFDVTQVLEADFIKWAGIFGIDYSTNPTFDEFNSFTWNYTGAVESNGNTPVSGYWRNIYKILYDTERPHTHPWEMLGLSQKPNDWESTYGPAPYTSGNQILWDYVETGGGNPIYARPGLNKILPVNQYGELIPPDQLLSNTTAYSIRRPFVFGDQGPVETAWRRSSFYPFAIQRLLALIKPAVYSSLLYDPSRINLNIAKQWTYGDNHQFLNPKNVVIYGDNGALTNGYSVYVSEYGQQRSTNYIKELKKDLKYFNINLFYKVGGFINKNNMTVLIDAYSPTSIDPGAILPQEDYSLFLNSSSPVGSANISGIVIQKLNGKFSVKGYDQYRGFFNVYLPTRNNSTPPLTIGGISESYVTWSSASSPGPVGLSTVDTTSAKTAPTTLFYTQGQLVSYKNKYYRVKVSHTAESSFNESLYVQLSELPITGGVTVQRAAGFSTQITKIPYGTEFSTIQEVYDFIIGYGHYLESRGFIFDEYNVDLGEILNWNFSAKEFLFWTSQHWVENSLITLSPFANQIKFKSNVAVVDNLFDSFHEYSILRADGKPFSQKNLSVNRADGICTISTNNTTQGIYFAILRPVQKEHGMVFKNTSLFNDTIFDIETGYRQLRVKLSGLRTSGWKGDFSAPGFVYDTANIHTWKPYIDYVYADTVSVNGKYYSAKQDIVGSATFNVSAGWILLDKKPVAGLIPNFDYKIGQFPDFYNLNIDNFDAGQEKMAQHLTGYTPRPNLNNIFSSPIAQYKFYQGYIREKGTKNSISKLSKASLYNLQGQIDYSEEWAFRVGCYGSFSTYNEIEFPLIEGTFLESPQLLNFVSTKPIEQNDLTVHVVSSDLQIMPKDFNVNSVFSTTGTDSLLINTAGYVRIDDVTATAYNENSLLDIANSSLPEGITVWLGFKADGDWDVLRYENTGVRIIGAYVSSRGVSITFTTDITHNLQVGDIIFCSHFNSQVDGIYRIFDTPTSREITVLSSLSTINSTNSTVFPGLLFKFISQRFPTLSQIPSDYRLLKLPYGSKLWIDDDGTGRWAVYQKVKNYAISSIQNSDSSTVEFGRVISKRKNSNVLMVAAPYGLGTIDTSPEIQGNLGGSGNTVIQPIVTNLTTASGKIYVYDVSKTTPELFFKYDINQDGYASVFYHHSRYPIETGKAMIYDDIDFNRTNFGLLFVGAPGACATVSDSIEGGLRYSTGHGTISTLVQEGLVKISSKSSKTLSQKTEFVLLSPDNSSNYQRFGSSLFVQRNSDVKLLLVGAPATGTTGTGAVYSYMVDSSEQSLKITYTGVVLPQNTDSISIGSLWGYSISGSDDAKFIAISAPGSQISTGFVSIYQQLANKLDPIQTINGSDFGFSKRDEFGSAITVSPDGRYLFVSAPSYLHSDGSYGRVLIFINNSGTFILNQILTNPYKGRGMKFGKAIDCNSDASDLIISAGSGSTPQHTTFDSKSPFGSVTFDTNETVLVDFLGNSGAVYVYNKKDPHGSFSLDDELNPTNHVTNSEYGISLQVDDNNVYVGSPFLADQWKPDQNGLFYQFKKINPSIGSWQKLREQPDLVDVNQFQKISLIDTFSEKIVDYLDIIDPVKGKIPGVAKQELKYISSYDPAIYSIGTASVNVNTNISWLDDHVGELWWDLSTVKYMWYEQGELKYRKNNWGKLFPGATIDVYEWVGTKYLPNEWSVIADTTAGLVESISGQPKYPTGNVMAVKQVYTSSGSLTNYYYYWVKNKITIPATKNRRKSSFEVASLIADPVSYGYKFLSPIAPSALSLANIGTELVSNNINLNIALDKTNNIINKHTEWLLLQEGNVDSRPNTLLEKKLIDSLLGHDSLGNPVPDPKLSQRMAYGIDIRPRQSMFIDRQKALRNLVGFVNKILISNQLTGNYNFDKLKSEQPHPDQYSHTYDQVVEDIVLRDIIKTARLVQAEISCTVQNGKINTVEIVNQGFGYKIPPTVTIYSNDLGTEAIITTEIDLNGKVISADIKNPGNNYTTAPILSVRPYTVLVLTDTDSNGKWAMYSWDKLTNQWIKIRTQLYNTSLYWKYVDYKSSTFNEYTPYSATIPSLGYLSSLVDAQINQYIKVNNSSDGNYIILEKTQPDAGNFSNNYNLVFKQNGTIQLLDTLWSSSSGNLGFSTLNYDQTLFDQTADIELTNIIDALKNDIFVGELKVNWNLFFFSAVKYALTEQKLLDWAFKTSFINVTNYAGNLDQRPVYKLQDSSYFINYISEVKPYHTQIRNYTTNHTYVDPSQTFTTDFDLPAIYNTLTNSYQPITLNDNFLNTYPWKAWAENYKFYVDSIDIGNPGSNYATPPTVELQTADGDFGSGATAKAYITGGQISKIIVLSSGKNYLKPPKVIIHSNDPNVKPAVAYARLANGTVRNNLIGMKFDRISTNNSFESTATVDTFICDGFTTNFELSWLADTTKSKMMVTLDGSYVLLSDFKIDFFTKNINGYLKKLCKIVFLNYTPKFNQRLSVAYNKNIELFNATERILNFYTATSGMPGLELGQLMTGIDFPKTNIQSLPFNYVLIWDQSNSNFGQDVFADNSNYYNLSRVVEKIPAPKLDNSVTVYTNTINLKTKIFKIQDHGFLTGTTVLYNAQGFLPIDGLVDGRVYFVRIIDSNNFSLYNTLANASNETSMIGLCDLRGRGNDLQTLTSVIDYNEIKVDTTENIKIGQLVNIISKTNAENKLNTTTDVTVVSIDHDTSRIFLSDPLVAGLDIGDIVEFWTFDSNSSLYDSNIIGGTFDNVGISNPFGINPEEINLISPEGISIDGSEFFTPDYGHAPEELVPGNTLDSFSLNVYTINDRSAPTVISSYAPLNNNAITTIKLSIQPTNPASISVYYQNKIFTYSNNTDFTQYVDSTEFTIDWINNTLIIAPQSSGGNIGYRIISIGGEAFGTYRGVIDSASQSFTNNEPIGQVQSLSDINTVKDAIVYVNGESIQQRSLGFHSTSTVSYCYFELGPVSTNNNRAATTVYNLPNGDNNIHSFFFGNTYKLFNEINQQMFTITASSFTSTATLTYPPKVILPEAVQAIVEINTGTGFKIMLPPPVTYYNITDRRISTFLIDPQNRFPQNRDYSSITQNITTAIPAGSNGIQVKSVKDFAEIYQIGRVLVGTSNKLFGSNTGVIIEDIDYVKNEIYFNATTAVPLEAGDVIDFYIYDVNVSYDPDTVRVYINGRQIFKDADFTVDSHNNSVTINDRLLAIDDVVAILWFPKGFYDYDIVGSQVTLSNFDVDAELNVITYTNHDNMMIETTTYSGNSVGRFKTARPILNNNYIWIILNGIPLINTVDYTVLNDRFTVQLSERYQLTDADRVEVISITDQGLNARVVGFRMFNDIFNRTSFKRLSAQNSTKLAQALKVTDTEIVVDDALVLTRPIISKKIPGVIIIEGERIEFYRIDGNVLSQLRRGTLGTSPSTYLEVGTRVTDQNNDQTMPFQETVLRQSFLTTSTTSTYQIHSESDTLNDGIVLGNHVITISTSSINLGNGIITVPNHGFLTGEAVLYSSHGNTPINGLVDKNTYFVRKISVNSFSLYDTSSNASNELSVQGSIKLNGYGNNSQTLEMNVPAVDQLMVFYGGRPLRKSGIFVQDTSLSYDNNLISTENIMTTATISLLPSDAKLGDAFRIIETNQVWIYENSLAADAIKGYVYRGLNYHPPEFSINTSTHQLTLNISEGIEANVKVVIIKKQSTYNSNWNYLNTGTSLQARFLQAKSAQLPDIWYYGGNHG